MDLSIIIVSYNTKELLKNTIMSVMQTLKQPSCTGELLQYEIIVSDNDSKDGSIEMIKEEFSSVKLVENEGNLGFSKGNNIAIKKAIGRYILLLNSDTEVQQNCLQRCVEYMDGNMQIGALGCKVLLENRSLDHACKRGFPTPEASLYYMLKLHKVFSKNKKFGAYTLGYLSDEEINEVDSLTGAFMMVRREAMEKVGMLDETFFMYGEDIDWCYRIKKDGYKIIYYPEATIIHYKGASSKKKRVKTIYEFHRAMCVFYNKHYRKKYNFLVTMCVYVGIFIKLILTYVLNVFKRTS